MRPNLPPAAEPTQPTTAAELELARVADVPPKPRRPRRPVGWLLAPELLAKLNTILHTRRGDPRDWMPVSLGHAHVEDGAPDAGRVRDIRLEGLGGAVLAEVVEPVATPRLIEPPESGELWFDYVGDTGDGEAAMYSVAYLLQAELRLGADADERDRRRGPVMVTLGDPGAGPALLPPGQFVLFGGDTAYHVADRATIAGRVRAPFAWAARDLHAAGAALTPRRRLYGIPGNHDWYDDLSGFGDLFRKGGTPAREHGPLDLAGFERVQTASYVGIELPWQWHLWGLDVEHGLDARQESYFRSLPRPDRLVVATHAPAVVFGAVMVERHHQTALERLDLPRYYETGAAAPPPGTCRLDLAGDQHHYARYETPGPAPATPPARFRSLVSGAGGAFHHPSFTMIGERQPSVLYPDPATSRRAVGRRLFNPLWLYRGGLIRAIPLLLCVCIAWAALSSTGTGWLFDRLLALVGIEHEAGLWSGAPVPMPARAGAGMLDDALGFLGCLVGAVVLIGIAISWGAGVSRAHDRQPDRERALQEIRGLRDLIDPKRSYWLSWLLGIGGAALPFVSPALFDFADPSAIWFDVLCYVLALIALVGGAGLALAGARRQPWPRQLVLAAVGMFHGGAQLLAPFVIARIAMSTWWTLPAMVAITTVGLITGHAVFARTRRLHPVLLAAVGLVSLAATLAVAIVAADGVAVVPHGRLETLVVFTAAPLAAVFFGCAQFGWYLAIAGAAGGHNNEVGGAALVDRYRQFIRFRLTPDRLTGYVIGLDDVSMDAGRLRPRLVDTFDVAP